jgi:uncharacterized membrane protein YfcA
MDLFVYFIYLLAGVCAGAITGLAGASAVVVTAPILIILLDMDAYVAIGLSLAADVVAAIIASRIYYKNKNIDLLPAIPLILSSFLGIVLGSYISTFIPSMQISFLTGAVTFVLGVLIFFRKGDFKKSKHKLLSHFNKKGKKRIILLSLLGFLIGLNAGIFGAGGGIALLIVLIFILGYSVHMAIGTSVFIMLFIAFFGAVSHFYYKPFSWIAILISCVGAFVGSLLASRFANLTSEKKLKKIVAIIFIVLGLSLVAKAVLTYFSLI